MTELATKELGLAQMKNGIYYDREFLLNDYLPQPTDFVAVLSGAKLQTQQNYLKAVESEFMLPTSCGKGILAHNAWMTDLSWLNAKRIIFVISDFSGFLQTDRRFRREMLGGFEKYILPFWAGETSKALAPDKQKEFYVFCLD